jgi:hypothetical protein
VTGEGLSLLLGYERLRSAVTASYAVVLPVLRRKFLTAGTSVAVAAPPSVRSFRVFEVNRTGVHPVTVRGLLAVAMGDGVFSAAADAGAVLSALRSWLCGW